MRVLARDGVAKVHSITAPLLFVSFVLVVAVHIPHVGVAINGARRWIGPRPAAVPALRADEARAGALLRDAARRSARSASTTCASSPNRCLIVVGAACLLVFTQPDLGTAMVIVFTISAMLVAAGIPMRKLAKIGRLAAGGGVPLRA